MTDAPLGRRLLAEFLGSALLAAVVIGSGLAAQRLSPGNPGVELLENAAATAAGLYAIILMFGQVSGGHFNPVVSLTDAALGGMRWQDAAAYLPAQVAGCAGGAVLANLMFAGQAVSISAQHRASPEHLLSEVVATAGLILVIFALVRTGREPIVPAAVGAYIGAAYFFTSSTSFANPAITVGRIFSASFAGIAPSSVAPFAVAQLAGGALAWVIIKALYPPLPGQQGDSGRQDAAATGRRAVRENHAHDHGGWVSLGQHRATATMTATPMLTPENGHHPHATLHVSHSDPASHSSTRGRVKVRWP
ncbi:MAG: MIP/aquaporin family protein [Streptosporangiaceae bacterium]